MKKLSCLLAALSVALALPVAADGLGRLFFTQQQRAYLDRGGVLQADQVPAPTVDLHAQAQAAQAHVTVSIDGYIRRSSGNDAAWLNGEQVDPGNASNGFTVGRMKDWPNVPVQLPNGKQAAPKIGDTIDENGNSQ